MTTLVQRMSFPIDLSKKPKIYSAPFGDGYEQRAVNGINNNPKQWTVSAVNLNDEDASALMTFLDTANGAASFDWTDPDGAAIKVTCKEYSRSYTDEDKNTVRAVLNQVYGE